MGNTITLSIIQTRKQSESKLIDWATHIKKVKSIKPFFTKQNIVASQQLRKDFACVDQLVLW